MITITQYTLIKKNDYMVAKSGEKLTCPNCGARVVVRDTRKRIVLDDSANKCIFMLKRCKCKGCGILHTVIPDCIIPYKSYSREVIEGVQNDTIDWCCADNATIYRWKKHT